MEVFCWYFGVHDKAYLHHHECSNASYDSQKCCQVTNPDSYMRLNDIDCYWNVQMENSVNCFSCTWFSCACWLCIFQLESFLHTHTDVFCCPKSLRQHILMGQWSHCNSNMNKHTWILVCFLLISEIRCLFVSCVHVGREIEYCFH